MQVLVIPLLALSVSACAYQPTQGHAGKAGTETALVCHKGKKTLNLPHAAVRSHLNHGDTLGPC